jgi:hypothetical protein
MHYECHVVKKRDEEQEGGREGRKERRIRIGEGIGHRANAQSSCGFPPAMRPPATEANRRMVV